MSGRANPYSQAREPRKRPRDESASPKPAPKRHSTGQDPKRRRSRSRSRDGRGSPSRRGRSPLPPRRRSPEARDSPRARDPPQAGESSAPKPTNSEPPRRRRPGASGAISKAQREAHLQQAAQREAERKKREEEWAAQQTNARTGIHEAVKEHYNLVPQRGREWRRTESKIKGVREFNNWIKSVMIQRFSPSQEGLGIQQGDHRRERLNVLDIGCGKGGDLFKWQKAPQRVGLYVGIDPADVSIQQATERYRDSRKKSQGRIFDAHFVAMDGYGRWLGEVPIIQQVGIDPSVGPGAGANARWGGGGFDVVTMMFCLHYAFESEEKARGMLKNVAGALKKGGRLLGVMPSSDVIRGGLDRFYKDWDKKWAAKKKAEAAKAEQEGTTNGVAKDTQPEGNKDSTDAPDSPAFMPDSPTFVPDSPVFAPESPGGVAEDTDKAAEAPADTNGTEPEPDVSPEDVPEHPEPSWGNSLYRVRFPPKTPRDGVFRPMYGWKYQFKLEEAVEEVPEYIVPFEGFRALAEEYNLEMTYSKSFMEIFDENRDDPDLGPLSVRMGVVDRMGGSMRMNAEEREAAAFYMGFVFVKI